MRYTRFGHYFGHKRASFLVGVRGAWLAVLCRASRIMGAVASSQ